VHLGEAGRRRFREDVDGLRPGGATAEDVALMRRTVGSEVGVKAAGGIRDLEATKLMIAAGATRVGASAGVKIVQEARK